MRKFLGIKIGGLQHKIFNLVLIFIILLMGAYAAVTAWYQSNLTVIVADSNARQQESISKISKETMTSVLDDSLKRITGLQSYIADELFSNVRAEVRTLQAFATGLFEHSDSFSPHPVEAPSLANDGVPSAQLISEEGADPEKSELLGLVGNMSDIMIAMYQNSDKMSSIFVGTADGHMVLVNSRPGVFIGKNGETLTLDIRNRPWYAQTEAAGTLIFTGVETDAYTSNPMIECAAPVYYGGKLVAVVAADIYLTSISDYIDSVSTESSFACIINENGQVLFSPSKHDIPIAELSAGSADVRHSENKELADFVADALTKSTEVETITSNGKEYYVIGAPLPSIGWTVVSAVDKEATMKPSEMMLDSYNRINEESLAEYKEGAKRSLQTVLVLSAAVIILAIVGALLLAKRTVKPIEHMTNRINSLRDGDTAFEMEKVYRTGDEIEVLAESFTTLSARTREYIKQITEITAEKERIGTELALATRIQADMLPNIYPAFPDRTEFDIYATMDPAKEVGGDFYDFFLIDDDHLCMVMADVSGKGVPAALFMMASKIILANNAMTGKSPSQILTDTNASICSNNREEMFVTVWLGILEISTGKLTCANAGHEYPVVRHANGAFELLKDKHGFVIGGMADIRYREYELRLDRGAKLFLYTDGVPEATNAGNELFGTERMIAALNAAKDGSVYEILGTVRKHVDGFVKEAEQFDDLTMLCLEYKGTDGPEDGGKRPRSNENARKRAD